MVNPACWLTWRATHGQGRWCPCPLLEVFWHRLTTWFVSRAAGAGSERRKLISTRNLLAGVFWRHELREGRALGHIHFVREQQYSRNLAGGRKKQLWMW